MNLYPGNYPVGFPPNAKPICGAKLVLTVQFSLPILPGPVQPLDRLISPAHPSTLSAKTSSILPLSSNSGRNSQCLRCVWKSFGQDANPRPHHQPKSRWHRYERWCHYTTAPQSCFLNVKWIRASLRRDSPSDAIEIVQRSDLATPSRVVWIMDACSRPVSLLHCPDMRAGSAL